MAIEITPKQELKVPIIQIIFLGICAVLLIAFFASYFYFDRSIKQISQKIQEKNLAAVPLDNAIKEKENELLPAKQKIDDFGKLLSEHKKPLNIFAFLERICLPNVWFSNFNFSFGEGGLTVSGETDSFITLEQQILIFKKEPLVKNVTLSGISIGEEGGADFSFLITFDPQIFK